VRRANNSKYVYKTKAKASGNSLDLLTEEEKEM
jgi:hypothetical protein